MEKGLNELGELFVIGNSVSSNCMCMDSGAE